MPVVNSGKAKTVPVPLTGYSLVIDYDQGGLYLRARVVDSGNYRVADVTFNGFPGGTRGKPVEDLLAFFRRSGMDVKVDEGPLHGPLRTSEKSS
jgi:hypothetical protein